MKTLNFKIIFNLLGMMMLMNALFMLFAVIVSLIYRDGMHVPMLISSVLVAFLGAITYFSTKNAKKKVGKREGYLVVGIGWIVLVLSGMIPYLLSCPYLPDITLEKNNWDVTNLFFETMSGYTTTGATILNDIEALPPSLLFWRSLTHWIGGMGIIVLAIAILPFLGIGGMQLFVAESSGIETNKLHPRITDTAKRLWLLYVVLTFLQTFILWIFGMGFFDALNHSMSTVSSGGFSTKNASTSYWNYSAAIQYTIILFMFLAGTNFVMVYHLMKGRIKTLFHNEEFKWYLGVTLSISFLVAIIVYFLSEPGNNSIPMAAIDPDSGRYTIENSIRYSLFQVISIITTTGFTSADHAVWPPFVMMIFFSLLFVGASAGSTSGGIKIVRHAILLKNCWFEMKRLIHPNAIIPVRYNKKAVSQTVVYNVMAFFATYMFIWIASSVLMTLLNSNPSLGDFDFISNASLTATSLGNVGPGLGHYGPVNNLSGLTDAAKWFSSFLMILGRLELFTILILFTPFLWRSN